MSVTEGSLVSVTEGSLVSVTEGSLVSVNGGSLAHDDMILWREKITEFDEFCPAG